jgi:hypothetical protein
MPSNIYRLSEDTMLIDVPFAVVLMIYMVLPSCKSGRSALRFVELSPSDRTVGCRLMEAVDELTG